MKYLFSLFLFFGLIGSLLAQVPQGFSYQAVARDAAGVCIQNSLISIRIGIRDTAVNGPVVYQEIHDNVSTNAQGLFSLTIGEGTPQNTLDFTSLDWSNGHKWMEVEMDPTNGFNFVSVGTQQLMSVPYAMYAERTSLPYAHFTTGDNPQVPQQAASSSTWTTFTGSSLTIPESGVYLLTAVGRAYGLSQTESEWVKFRIYNQTQNEEIGFGWIGKANTGSNGDQTGTINTIHRLQKGDVLGFEYYVRSNLATWTNGPKFGGNADGYSSLSAVWIQP